MVISKGNKRYFILLGFLFLFFNGLSQIRTIFISDKLSDIPIAQSNVTNIRTKNTVNSNHAGYCHIEANVGDSLFVSHVSYNKQVYVINSTGLRVEIQLSPMELEGVHIYAGEPFNCRAAKGIEKIPMKFLTSIPSFLGEPDILKALTFLPGVSEGREGYSHLFVRGGDQDQNLILLDGATILNANHIGGLISMFQPEMIGGVDFYKSYWPSIFGGRLSSVVDIRTAEGNFREHKQAVQLGIIAPKFSLSGPLIKDSISYHIGGRRTLIDLITAPIKRQIKNGNREGDIGNLISQDFTFRIDGRLKENQQISISSLLSRDRYLFVESYPNYEHIGEEGYGINNEMIALNYRINNNKSSYFTAHASYSGYGHYFNEDQRSREGMVYTYQLEESNQSGNKVRSMKLIVYGESQLNGRLSVKYGMENEWNNYSIYLKRWKKIDESYVSRVNNQIDQDWALTSSISGDLSYRIARRLNLNSGLRLSRYAYSDYTTWLWEPKVLLTYELDNYSTLNTSFNLQRQHNILLGFVDNMGRFREFYVSSDQYREPSISKQWSIGYFRNLDRFIDNLSIEFFYKNQLRIHKFVPSTDIDKDVLEYTDYLHGDGKAKIYGLETLLQKTTGNVHGSISYTYAHSNVIFPSLNEGREFNADFDFRHNFNFLLMYSFGKGYSLSGHWTYKTGRPYSMPSSYFESEGHLPSFPVTTDINNMRMPAFHRLDLNFDRRWKTKKGGKNWFGIGVYNVYNRVNPFFARPSSNSEKLEIIGMFPIIPFFNLGFER